MSQLVLPHTIDAGTEIVAAEHQANYTAIRDLINGNLEGGGGVDNNFKANGVTAREIHDQVLSGAGANGYLQEGVFSAGDLRVTPGAGLALNYASGIIYIDDDNGVVAPGVRVPVAITGSTVTIAANSSGNPRLDRIVVTLTGWGTGTVSVVQGTATAGATLDNLAGAPAIPAGAIQVAMILMPNGFAGPFVQATHIRDRRNWARGFFRTQNIGTGANINPNNGAWTAIDSALNMRAELSGRPVLVTLGGEISGSVGNVRWGVGDNAAGSSFVNNSHASGTSDSNRLVLTWTGYASAPSPGTHLIVPSYAMVVAGNWFLYRDTVGGTTPSFFVTVQEIMQQISDNSGA